jgi:thiol-disulfide isomerase/thioredoxin
VSEPPPRARAAGLRALLTGALLLGCAAGGFLLYRLAHPPPTLRAAPAPPAAPSPPPLAGAAVPPEAAPAAPPRRIPEVVPDLTLPGLDGKPHHLSEWQGRPLLINFWASWCEPCRREIPLLKSIRRDRAADHLEVVGIAIDFRDAARKYAHDSRIDYPVLVGEQGGYEAVAAFGMEPVLPFSVFADGSGHIVSVKIGELHRDESRLILDTLHDLAGASLTLAAARERIAQGMATLTAQRTARSGTAQHQP